MTLEPGTLLNGRYRIIEILGQGGMGAVYHAVDEHLDNDVAVKENQFLSDEYSRQFRQEAVILSRLRHPILPRVSDYFSIAAQGQYMVMDYIEGEDLRKRMERQGPLGEEVVILIGSVLCEALSYLHSRRPPIIHRDIKPGNVKITPSGQIVLVDFGLAKIMSDQQITSTGARAMTPGYSPPEQYGTARTDARTDIYSLAATLYAALTGMIPEDSLARATGNADLTPVRQLAPSVRDGLAAIIEKGLALEPENRYQDADAFRHALSQAITDVRSLRAPITIDPGPASTALAARPGTALAPVAIEPGPRQLPTPGRLTRRTVSHYWPALAILLAVSSGLLMIFRPDRLSKEVILSTQVVSPVPTQLEPQASPTENPAPTLPVLTPKFAAFPVLTPQPPAQPTALLFTAPTATQVGGGPGQIAFVSLRTGIPQIWRMDPNGSGLKQMTNLPNGACQPVWSPDGKAIAFVSPCHGRRDMYLGSSLYIQEEDGTIIPVPPSPQGDFDPAWSPDGIRIAYTSLREGRPQVYVYNRLDHSVRNLSTSVFADRQPAWNPSGSQIAFIRTRTSGQVWIMSDGGQRQEQFSRSGEFNDSRPIWSPDTRTIFFSQSTRDDDTLWLMGMRYEDRGSGQEFRIPVNAQDVPGPVRHPSISPDGTWIVIESWPEGTNHDIYRMTISGANYQRLTTDRDLDFEPAWNPASANP